jgi:hypothetical protein
VCSPAVGPPFACVGAGLGPGDFFDPLGLGVGLLDAGVAVGGPPSGPVLVDVSGLAAVAGVPRRSGPPLSRTIAPTTRTMTAAEAATHTIHLRSGPSARCRVTRSIEVIVGYPVNPGPHAVPPD